MAQEKFKHLIDDVARQIVATEHDLSGAFIRLPMLYPSGGMVVVRIQKGDNRFFVSDFGLGYQETELYGASTFYMRHAKSIAEKSGVGFDNQAFFILEASREQLAGAVVTIANCSQEAAMRAADAQAEKTFEDSKEVLYERLVSVFAKKFETPKKIVTKNARIIGSSATEWAVATLVRLPGVTHPTIFEPVTKHHNSVANATMKFHDISRLGKDAPARVAVVHKKEEFGTYLSVLSQAANVVDDTVADDVLVKLAKAA